MRLGIRKGFLILGVGVFVVAGVSIGLETRKPVDAPGQVISPSVSDGLDRWMPSSVPTALLDCSSVEELCIKFDKITVNKTPNDPGEWEEWQVLYGWSEIEMNLEYAECPPGEELCVLLAWDPGLAAHLEIKVKDKIGSGADFEYPGIPYEVNKEFCIPKWGYKFDSFVRGKEDDQWPTPDDSIPEVRILTYNACTTPAGEEYPPNIPVRTGNTIGICKWDSDIDRYACYHFTADYR